MRGAIYLSGNSNVTISGSNFTTNDCGPLLEKDQIVGMVDTSEGRNRVRRSSAIFVGDRSEKVLVENCTFSANSLDFMQGYIDGHNQKLSKFYPAGYFSKSQAPQLTVY